ncbi:glucose-1-phosphate thymidylyltransferase RfbA [Actinoplanes sp. NEAU-A12]|uniref:Glucose-1-phosphate thymidylyltransferase n=1 Tax=Actinoplanes sandaracinus TaxID=3045177 RepID=A0ABT6WGS2_9ACTN|nr:glucose-1-phosphate thymidylyltransferase RfbA [Actinoplanes sandaracinus]MDI6098923.1 glucose-1-phosphate thymidylyltransferase RfbA [Actinoplanes sandaracinus]
MRGILLAGGTGSRLRPVTWAVSKQLMPVYDKPMIYYPLSTLIGGGIREILVITNEHEVAQFQRLLGDGSQWGLRLEYAIQQRPAGIAEAFLIGEEFLAGEPAALMLGDNLLHGVDFRPAVRRMRGTSGGHVFGVAVADPSAYGVVEFDGAGRVLSIEEKPERPRSPYAVPGFYLYDADVVGIARALTPSPRGELEITAVNEEYRRRGALSVTVLPRGAVWLDTGTLADCMRAVDYVRAIDEGQGIKIGCVEEAAWRAGFIDDAQLRGLAEPLMSSGYGEYLVDLAAVDPFVAGQQPLSAAAR